VGINAHKKEIMRPTWAEVSLTALQHNFRTIADYVEPEATVCAVVKADAYGHGAVECARALQQVGCLWLGVTSADEGMRLRNSGIGARILLMSGFWRGEEQDVIAHNLTPAVWDWGHIELLEDAARQMHASGKESPVVPVHLKVDTGMSRLGIACSDTPIFTNMIKSAEHVSLEAVFTHLASAEIVDSPDVSVQIERFEEAVATVLESGLNPAYYHVANSAAIAARQNARKNLVRPGISLYGYYLPFTSVISGTPDSSLELPVQPVLTWKTRIQSIRDVPAHQPISYNGSYVTQAPARIGVLPVGYADGLRRQLSSRGRVIVRDDYAAMVGNITMDMTMIDITGIPGVDVGDEVILIGRKGPRSISAWEHASLAATIPYEILCGISSRVPRRYVE
jgi:alanine racemase